MSTGQTIRIAVGAILGVGLVILFIQLYPDLRRYLKMSSL